MLITVLAIPGSSRFHPQGASDGSELSTEAQESEALAEI